MTEAVDVSAEADHVLDELFPEKEEAFFGIAEIAVAGELDDPVGEVVVDLPAHFVFDVLLGLIRIGDAEVFVSDAPFDEEVGMVREDLIEAGLLTGDVIPVDLGVAFEGGREGEIGAAPDAPSLVFGSDADEGEGNFLLFAKTDDRDGFLFGVPENAEILLHSGPFPGAIGDMIETLVFHGMNRIGGVGKGGVGGGRGAAEAVFKGESQATDAGEEFHPRKKKPTAGTEGANEWALAGEVKGEKGGDNKDEGTQFT